MDRRQELLRLVGRQRSYSSPSSSPLLRLWLWCRLSCLPFPIRVHQQMQIQSMKKQANRYVEYWGPGAIVFALVRHACHALVQQQGRHWC